MPLPLLALIKATTREPLGKSALNCFPILVVAIVPYPFAFQKSKKKAILESIALLNLILCEVGNYSVVVSTITVVEYLQPVDLSGLESL